MDFGTVLRDGRTAEIRQQLLPHIRQLNCLFAERRTKTIELCLTMSSLRRDLPHGYWVALIRCGDLDMKKSAADQHAHSGDTLRNLTAHNYGQLPAHFSALHQVCRLSHRTIEELIAASRIHRKLSYSDAKDLVAEFLGKKQNASNSNLVRCLKKLEKCIDHRAAWTAAEHKLATHKLTQFLDRIRERAFKQVYQL